MTLKLQRFITILLKSNVAVVDLWRSFSNYAGNGNGDDKENVAGFWRPMGILNPNSKGKKELYSHRICCFLLVLG
ncbi:hypothetical protein V6Z11_A06G102500 [Gossypium hirsutum]